MDATTTINSNDKIINSNQHFYYLDGPLGLDGRDGAVDVLRDNITTVQETTGHVLSVSGITFHHLPKYRGSEWDSGYHGEILKAC